MTADVVMGFPYPVYRRELRHGQDPGSLRVLEVVNRIHSVLRSLYAGLSGAFSSMQPSAGVKVPSAFRVPIMARAVLGFHSPLCPPGLHRGEDKGYSSLPALEGAILVGSGEIPNFCFLDLALRVCLYDIYIP